MALASGSKYPAPAEVPGLRMRTLSALGSPVRKTPTTFRFSGVPGAGNPRTVLNLTGTFAADAGARYTATAAMALAHNARRINLRFAPAIPLSSGREFPETRATKCIDRESWG